MSSKSTYPVNGARAKGLRGGHIWTREDMVWQTHLTVERLAALEPPDSPLNQRLRARLEENRLAGISHTRLTDIENGECRVLPMTLRILAETLQVPMKSLIADEPGSGENRPERGEEKAPADADKPASGDDKADGEIDTPPSADDKRAREIDKPAPGENGSAPGIGKPAPTPSRRYDQTDKPDHASPDL